MDVWRRLVLSLGPRRISFGYRQDSTEVLTVGGLRLLTTESRPGHLKAVVIAACDVF